MKPLSTCLTIILTLAACGTHAQAANQPARPANAAKALGAPALAASLAAFDAGGAGMGHPRLFQGRADHAGIVAATRAERRPGLNALLDYLKRHPAGAAPAQLKAQIAAQDQSARMAGWWQQARMLEGMAEAAFAWYVKRDDWLLDEMRARMRLFGPSVLARDCRGDVAETRDYVWYFALAYDFAYAGMNQQDRALVHDVIVSCAGAALAATPDTVRKHPDNPIAFNALGKLVGALLIVRGDMPDTRRLLARALPAYVASLSPWGGQDGGFANGSSYAMWDAGESLLAWDLIERVLGVPLYRKPWVAALPRYLAYAVPPGTPAGAFGDGAEVERGEEWARLGKAIANRSATPVARWYAGQLKGEDYARLNILLSPRQQRGAAGARSLPNGASFPSVGVAAMHSALADPQRVSVLFKSSPFGSLNHSHADQNSFVLYGRGKVLAMDSGVYDSYNSAHWRGWYKQTRAHNAITFDGGQGQQLGPLGQGSRAANGKLASFTSTPAYDIAVGDARTAYGGDIRQARRTLVFIRPATLVVVDQLRADSPHTWEWNLHTPAPLAGPAEGGEGKRFRVNVEGVSMCGALEASGPLALNTVPGYNPAPQTRAGPHYGHRFAMRAPSSGALFVAVLRVDCGGPRHADEPRIAIDGGSASVRAGGRTINVSAAGVTVAR